MTETRVGIGVTTYNRAAFLETLIPVLRSYTARPVEYFVADDGSTDDTPALLTRLDIPHVSASNRGIAWNKNRALFQLRCVRQCDVVILIEDDTIPTQARWEEPWIEAALRYGHVNVWPDHWDAAAHDGTGTVENPFVSSLLTGQCSAFSGAALDLVGFMDTRFRKYGFEHIEHTRRMITAGFGGVVDAAHQELRPFLIRSPLTIHEIEKPVDEQALLENKQIFDRVKHEPLFRPAARNDEELALLRAELAALRQDERPGLSCGPDWQCRAAQAFALRFDAAAGHVLGRADVTHLPRIALRVRGTEVRLRATGEDGAWLRLVSATGFAPVAAFDDATAFTLVSAPGAGFGLFRDGAYLCCDRNDSGRVTLTRPTLNLWETFCFDGYRLPFGPS
ncbi:glycosyltransferase [Acidomonas methanolica]|uniref:Glycosyl transferase family 2 n=1 Tax=Acidomonas methanolica NBRC 104435 TaxID=1231351 RepID=A0A023D143_ACIMT|nr:glycosyltransferase [Acidomonas methanolica]MBU2654929.1 glycosyltransferase [Acidomonas methanolica]TCS26280.1 glycosyl transferase family 2 [Acidomonas methanolica]GAJ27774.1 glycosyl transferase family 2 [Acidomonas methanolica NBRC 104435]GBQ52479.1 hypothetical protein AA0498_1755 [Acidomonas methanolica]GEK99189.1 hypothetical protein AME01nite_16880 [Acidomonas methanolica NBRC 104435]